MTTIQAYAANSAGSALAPMTFTAPPLAADDVEIKVAYCGICHSDLSMIDNEWNMSHYPLVPGHEIIGTVARIGDSVKGLSVGQAVGVGWTAASCQHCDPCIAGKGNLCGQVQGTIVGEHTARWGGFADTVRAQWQWVIPMPDGIDLASAGPLLCGGITVFTPLLQHGIDASKKVAVVGIGGLGHMALQFFSAWGCEVTAFSSHAEKYDEIRQMGAHHVINSRDEAALKAARGSFDLIVSTVNVSLNWSLYLAALKPEGVLHTVGAVLEPLAVPAFSLISGAKSVSGSPTGSASQLRTMINFAARKQVVPIIETYPMSQVNEALDHVRAGSARYRVVLEADF